MARKPKKLPDYFTSEETSALVATPPRYQVRSGLRVSECLSLRPADLRLN